MLIRQSRAQKHDIYAVDTAVGVFALGRFESPSTVLEGAQFTGGPSPEEVLSVMLSLFLRALHNKVIKHSSCASIHTFSMHTSRTLCSVRNKERDW